MAAAPSPSKDPAFDQPASLDGWRPAVPADTVAASEIEGLTWTGSRFVAVNEYPDAPAFMESPDGINWSVQHSDPAWHPASIRILDGAVYALGRLGEPPASWRSSDGSSWTRVPAIPGVDVVATDHGWVAVGGLDTQICPGSCPPIRGLAWTSADGRAWVKAPRQASLEHAFLRAIVPNGNAYLAAGEIDGHGALWSSPDGGTWTRVGVATVGGHRDRLFSVGGLAWLGDTLVLVGSDNTQDSTQAGAYWSVGNLSSWHPADIEGARGSQMIGLSDRGPQLLAFGPSGGCPGGIWSTSDGRRWSCVARGDRIADFLPWAVASSSSVEVAAGIVNINDENAEKIPGAIWWRPVPP
jgi:hypothetical protein